MENQIKVGISDYKISKSPNSLMTLGLGSCVGIAIFDKKKKIGGLSHIMLPDSKIFSNPIKIEKYADLAIPKMVEDLLQSSCNKSTLVAKIAGGASMFNFPDKKMTMDIGRRNIEAVQKKLTQLKIPILSKHVGGNKGRTMIVNLETFEINIRSANRDIIVI